MVLSNTPYIPNGGGQDGACALAMNGRIFPWRGTKDEDVI